jgi:hypothetical protein
MDDAASCQYFHLMLSDWRDGGRPGAQGDGELPARRPVTVPITISAALYDRTERDAASARRREVSPTAP